MTRKEFLEQMSEAGGSPGDLMARIIQLYNKSQNIESPDGTIYANVDQGIRAMKLAVELHHKYWSTAEPDAPVQSEPFELIVTEVTELP